ncbi:MAG: PIN domain-containing protein [Solirubrobacteraceae bacterium]
MSAAPVLDAFAVVAHGLSEPAAPEVDALLHRGDCRISAVNFAEALDRLGRVGGRTQEQLRTAFAMLDEALTVVAMDRALAWRAAELRRRHYRRRGSELSLADCAALATAQNGSPLATADPPLARAARAEGVEVLALPDSRGRRP